MECLICDVLSYGMVFFLFVQLVRFIFADADLHLLYKFRFGLQPSSLSGKTVWITGASSGIGEYLAYDLAKAGCRLVLSARRVSELERVKKGCLTSSNIKEDDIVVQGLDLLDYNSHAGVVENVLSHVSKIDILVNNGGRSQRALITDTSLDVDKQLMELNTLGTISLTKAVLPHFVQNKSGHLVVTSSVAGKVGAPMSATYSASKHALQGWFEALRIEYAEHNVHVTMICPGPVYSNITVEAFTGNPGKKYGETMGKRENRMKTERCTELMAAAIANRLGEVWISNQPILTFTYVVQYMPDIARWLGKRIGLKNLKQLRESKR